MDNLWLHRLPWADIHLYPSEMMSKVCFSSVFSELVHDRSDDHNVFLASSQERCTFLSLWKWNFSLWGCVTD